MYWHQKGPIQQHVVTSAKRVKGTAPTKSQDVPELRWGLELYYNAFSELDRERSHGMGWTRIPWSAAARYSEFYELSEDQTDRLFAHIRAMDDAYLTQLDADAEAKRAKK